MQDKIKNLAVLDIESQDFAVDKDKADNMLNFNSNLILKMIKQNKDEIEKIPCALQCESLEINPQTGNITCHNVRLGINIIFKQ